MMMMNKKTAVIPIQGTFDIAQARATLRTHLALFRWSPLFTARASTAVTALGELIIAFEHGRVCPVRMQISNAKKPGIDFICKLHIDKDDDQARTDYLLKHLDTCVDWLDINEIDGMINLHAKMLV